MAKTHVAYVCLSCGAEAAKWMGKCPSCGEWGTMKEFTISKQKTSASIASLSTAKVNAPIRLGDIEITNEPRLDTGNAEFNRVLGGGLVPGSMVLIGGEPGIGKSTLVLQVILNIKNRKTLYVSGEESVKQLKLRAERLDTRNDDCLILAETSLERIANAPQHCCVSPNRRTYLPLSSDI